MLFIKNEQLPVSEMSTGFHEVRFDAQDLPSGIYVYKIEAGEFVARKNCLLLK